MFICQSSQGGRNLPRMRDRSMRSGTELAQDIQLTDWSRAREHVKNLSNQFSGVQISCDICTRLGRYLYSTKQCWVIILPKLSNF